MLVLTRKLQEQICIGDNITLTILRVKGNTVRVGIDAPREVRVIRAELPRTAQPTAATGVAEAADKSSRNSVTRNCRSEKMTGDGPRVEPSEPNRLQRLVLQVTQAAVAHAV